MMESIYRVTTINLVAMVTPIVEVFVWFTLDSPHNSGRY